MKRRDDGAVTPFLMLLVVALTAVLGLVAEGGQVMSAREAAAQEAEQAARAGASVLSAAKLRSGGIATGGPAAVAAAEELMAASGHPGLAWASGTSVTARIDPYEVATPMLAVVGILHIAVSAEASARAVAR